MPMMTPKTHPQPSLNPSKKPISKTVYSLTVFLSLMEVNPVLNGFPPINLNANVHKKRMGLLKW